MRLVFLILLFSTSIRLGAAEAEALPERELKEARRLYQSKCARCHKFYEPSGYGGAEWSEWMEKMRKQTKLKPRQHDLVTRYTELLRTGVIAHPDNRAVSEKSRKKKSGQ
jgi:hypothetical protein